MQNVFNSVKSQALGVAEMLTPVLRESKFRETGVLTPEEFVASGDHIVHLCPTWQWYGGDAVKQRSYLPPDKQYLVTRNVPCYRRAYRLERGLEERIIHAEGDPDGGWVDTYPENDAALTTQLAEMSLSKPTAGTSATTDTGDDDDDDDDEEAADMEAFMQGSVADVIDDEATTVKPRELAAAAAAARTDPSVGAVEKVRTYDLFITYDKYYQTPRLWLVGYDEAGKPLTVEHMFEDFSSEHAHKTITMETFPHATATNATPMASIHPCRHADVMKRLLSMAAEAGNDIGVHLYLLIFLKFVQAVIPTVDYDFTKKFSL